MGRLTTDKQAQNRMQSVRRFDLDGDLGNGHVAEPIQALAQVNSIFLGCDESVSVIVTCKLEQGLHILTGVGMVIGYVW